MKKPGENKPSAGHDEIARLARELWERDGRPGGRDLEYWLKAESQILSTPRPQTTSSGAAGARSRSAQGARKASRTP